MNKQNSCTFGKSAERDLESNLIQKGGQRKLSRRYTQVCLSEQTTWVLKNVTKQPEERSRAEFQVEGTAKAKSLVSLRDWKKARDAAG